MKAAIYNPYLDTLGGGERYTMAFANVLSKHGYKVDVEWKDSGIGERLADRFGIKLTNIDFVESINRGDGYDVCFWVSDGSIPALKARKNILHFQFPFRDIKGKTLLNKMKLYRVANIVCNSEFTKSFIDKEYGVNSVVVYPPIDTRHFKSKRKENMILYVGRFSQLTQAKGQDVLIKAFRKLCQSGVENWKLVLTGGTEVGVDTLEPLKRMAKDYPIEIIESPAFSLLKDLYGKARIYWSASGFGVNEKKDPTKVEHFGITVVEAMSAGCVPIIVDAGGHREIVRNGDNGLLWKTISDLLRRTRNLIGDSRRLNALARAAKEDSMAYSYEVFENNLFKLIK